ncbi:MAG: hypothetical protein IPL65_04665 [Lewinellaceae bacterium]|nr:hypothetical protein [Lewinellaceae bacterium]
MPYVYSGADATATDNCGPVTITNNYNMTSTIVGASFPAGVNGAPLVHNIVWTATAPGMPGMVTCNQSITISDDDKPVFTTCPPNVTKNASAVTTCDYTVVGSEFDAVATDNCSTPTYMNDYDGNPSLAGQVFGFGTYTITWTATDAQSNATNNCTFTLTVQDASVPTINYFNPADGSNGLYNVMAAGCKASVTVEQPSNFIVDPVYCNPFFVCSNYDVFDCSGWTIARAPNAVIDGFVPPFNPLDPTNRKLTLIFPWVLPTSITLFRMVICLPILRSLPLLLQLLK